MYRVRHWNHDRDEMTWEFIEALAGITIDGYVSATIPMSLTDPADGDCVAGSRETAVARRIRSKECPTSRIATGTSELGEVV
jgi:hypothetical protein